MGINDLTSTSHAEFSRCVFFHWDGARYDLRESYIQVKRFWHSYEWPQHQGGHGGISKSQFRIPIAINHEIKESILRSIDLYTIILRLLGIKNRVNSIN